ncbi:MAG: hypothetical protein PVSMB4_04810 [Ktedonobacterales bacterium]
MAIGAARVAGLSAQTLPRAHAATIAVPAGLPSHFSFGLMDGPGSTPTMNDMRTRNGTAWDYRYQYLVGGVNTGHGWETWNAPSGAFATYYMQDSATNAYMPSFVYYEMFQSNGSCGSCGESQRDLSNLNNSGTMSAYYANWTLLMQEIGTFGKPALVIVEPDLWGYIEQAAATQGNSAAGVVASVASSGNADAAGLPNTAQGFAWALLHIRDRYAHNAVLALHNSLWGTGIDIASNTSSSLDIAGLASRQAQFLNTAGLVGNPGGISTFDLISNDVADHDSGQSGIWWDRNNVTFPNFARYLQYIGAVSTGTARRIMMWQVPIGNQYFDTLNNSQGHTQDNRAEYIIGHIADLANAGIIGVLFGPGNGGTWAGDGRNDGITNPAPISTYECNLCNTHTSSYADDDGGYLRIYLGQYYRSGGYQLGGTTTPPPASTATATQTSTATATQTSTGTMCVPTIAFGSGSATPATASAGQTVALATTFTASCATSGLVDYEVYNAAGQKVWQNAQDNQSLTGQAQTFQTNWTIPSTLAAGSYSLSIGVFKTGWGALYGWKSGVATITVAASAPSCGTATPHISFGSGAASPATAAPGSTVRLSIAHTSSWTPLGLVDDEAYNAAGQKVWQTWQDNQSLTGQAQTFQTSWTLPSTLPAGTYTFKVGVFGPGWSAFYGWDNAAATLVVSSGATAAALQNAPCVITIGGTQRTGTCTGTITF